MTIISKLNIGNFVMAKTLLFFRIVMLFVALATLASCGLFGEGDDEFADTTEEANTDLGEQQELTLAAAQYLPWLPWFLASQENLFDIYRDEYNVNIKFVGETSYDAALNKFIGREVDAVAATNIDTLTKIATRGLDADVILISSYSVGNDAVMIPLTGEPITSGQPVALKGLSPSHYLLDRYLLRHQIGFEEVPIIDTSEDDLATSLENGEALGLVSWNPVIGQLLSEEKAKVLFSTQEIPKEIFHVIVVHREALVENPNFARALLAIWFSIMERLQGNNKGATLDSMAALTSLDREEFDKRWDTIELTETPTKALSTLRDRRNHKKAMRHLLFFMRRHEIASEIEVSNWVSYPGRTPSLLHFNARPLQDFVAPAEEEI